jgi:hypothetical protein
MVPLARIAIKLMIAPVSFNRLCRLYLVGCAVGVIVGKRACRSGGNDALFILQIFYGRESTRHSSNG